LPKIEAYPQRVFADMGFAGKRARLMRSSICKVRTAAPFRPKGGETAVFAREEYAR